MIDRYNSKNSIVGTLYLTATHLIFVDPEANKETWVSLRGCSLTYQFHAILRSTLTSQFGWNIGFRFLSKPLMYGTRVNLELWNIEQSPIGFIPADPINVPRICIAIRRLLRESPRPFVLLHNEFMNFHKKKFPSSFYVLSLLLFMLVYRGRENLECQSPWPQQQICDCEILLLKTFNVLGGGRGLWWVFTGAGLESIFI